MAATVLMRSAMGAAVLVACASADARAQLDPLLFLQRNKPNVIIAIDVANRMQRDADEAYYDHYSYPRTLAAWEAVIGVTPANTLQRYRRKYVALEHLDVMGGDRFRASSIWTVGDASPGYAQFWARTRLSVARLGLIEAVQRNGNVARFGLVKMRQSNPSLGSEKNEGPVWVTDEAQLDPTETSKAARWAITRPVVGDKNGSAPASVPLVRVDAPTANADVLAILARNVDQAGALIPAGQDSRTTTDAPVAGMLSDARSEAMRAIGLDCECRNTVVILVVGGGEGNTAAGDPAATASTFLNVSGHRVPVYVIAIAPPDASRNQLSAIATNSGGGYFEITKAMIEATPLGSPVAEVVRAANAAVQHAFASRTDVDTAPSALWPLGPLTEFQTSSPVVGTVNLENGVDINGGPLPGTRITSATGTVIPQRSNVLVTAGFALPGFDGRMRGFRMYKPEADAARPPYGYAFVSDGTPLWVADVPPAAGRNIFTALPDGQLIAFKTENQALLAPYLNAWDPASLIEFVRSRPLGAIVGSTPAFLDPPSLDPPPDADYPGFAAELDRRRSLIFIGANDGMLHAIDARTGVEAWAFVPFNLLPKLKALLDGQAVGGFSYFVDSSPKIADVKLGDEWRTYLIVGQGPGGTFYHTFDVTLEDLPGAVAPDDGSTSGVLGFFADPRRIDLVWTFPSMTSFDPSLAPYGDIRASAPAIDKTVGETWSDPAVGQVESEASEFVVLMGSGFLPYTRQQSANRGGAVAGTTLYMLRMADGAVLDSRSVGSDGLAETVDSCSAAGNCTRMKNALQADPVAAGPPESRYMTKVYVGDLDGRVWRVNLGLDGSGTPRFTTGPAKLTDMTAAHPIFSSMATVNVGGTQDYIFFGTGSDLLSSVGVSQSYKLVGVLDQSGTGTRKFETALEKTDGILGDEKVSAFPAVAGDIVFFATSIFRPGAACTPDGASLYALTFIGGAAYDTNNDGRLTSRDTPKVRSVSHGRATAPFVVDQHLVFASGGKVEIIGDPRDYNNGVGQMGVRTLSWRERR
ncbi:MAG: PilC/PilY family type IV pilus protein [Acidobacteriota bacterium]